MRTYLRLFVCAAAVFLAPVITVAQEVSESPAREIIEEKTRWTPEQVIEAQRQRQLGHNQSPNGAASAAEAAAEAREVVVSGENAPESEVHAAINPRDSNNIVVSPIRIGSAADGLLCPVYYTRDFGRTWRKSEFKTLPKGKNVTVNGGGDPILAFDEDGTAHLIWIALYYKPNSTDTTFYGLYWASSTDGGETWQQSDSDAVAFNKFARTASNPEIYDKEWLAVDRTNGPRRNTLYLAFLQAGGNNGRGRIVVRRKLPGEQTWSRTSVPVSIAGFYLVQFTNVEVDNQGNVHVTFFGGQNQGANSLWHAVSTDGAATFGAPVKIADVHYPRFSTSSSYSSIPGIQSRRMYPSPVFAVDHSNGPGRGNLYAAWTADGTTTELGDGLDIYFSRSLDNGQTWSSPLIVNDDPRGRVRHQHYPTISVTPNGVVVLSWYDRRDDSTHRIGDYVVAYSFNGGVRFSHMVRASERSTDFGSIGALNSGFGIGEYTQVLSTSGYAIPVWTDGRTGDGDLNIFAAFLPIDTALAGVERISSVTDGVQLGGARVLGNEAEIPFTLTSRGHVRMTLFDAVGRQVAVLVNGDLEPGQHTVRASLQGLASGRYYIHLRAQQGWATRELDLVR